MPAARGLDAMRAETFLIARAIKPRGFSGQDPTAPIYT
jgi:hypothetical protein